MRLLISSLESCSKTKTRCSQRTIMFRIPLWFIGFWAQKHQHQLQHRSARNVALSKTTQTCTPLKCAGLARVLLLIAE